MDAEGVEDDENVEEMDFEAADGAVIVVTWVNLDYLFSTRIV